jgi:hypothetical protein
MGRLLVLTALLGFLTGCFKAKEPEQPAPAPPTAPGVSVLLRYPVVMLSERTLRSSADEQSLITTQVSSGLAYGDFELLDADGMRYAIVGVTPFGKTSGFFDMGTKPYQVFLTLKSKGKVTLPEAKKLVLQSAITPFGPASTPHGADVAREQVGATQSVAELVALCDKSWSWR